MKPFAPAVALTATQTAGLTREQYERYVELCAMFGPARATVMLLTREQYEKLSEK